MEYGITTQASPRPPGVDERAATVEAARHLLESVRLPSRSGSGTPPGGRPAHISGLFVSGSFIPSKTASEISTSSLFVTGSTTPFTARFSPTFAAKRHDLHGLAIKFDPGKAGRAEPTTDLVAMNLDRFFFRSADDFAAFVRDLRGGPRGLGRALVQFTLLSAGKRASWRALGNALRTTLETKTPLARLRYHGIHTFFALNETLRAPIRYRLEPTTRAIQSWGSQPVGQRYRDLSRSIRERPVTFDLVFILPWKRDRLDPWNEVPARTRDRLIDPTRRWTDSTERNMGTLCMHKVVDDNAFQGRQTADEYDSLLFDPTKLADGLFPSEDELLTVRGAVYAESHMRRVT